MPRRSKGPRYYPSKGYWVANLNGERVKLVEGPKAATKRLAQERYDALVKAKSAEADGDRAECWAVLNAYLDHCRTRTTPPPMAPSTYRLAEYAIKSFTALFGTVRVRDLKKRHLQEWLSHYAKERKEEKTGRVLSWGSSSLKSNMAVLVAAFKWAASQGELISESPFERRGAKVPWPQEQRLHQRLAVTDKEHLALCHQADRRSDKNFFCYWRLLWATGARPAELWQATAAEWQPALQSFVIDPQDPSTVGRLKNRRHLLRAGKKRIIRVPDANLVDVEYVKKMYPTGPLFRTEDGKPWTASNIAGRFESLVLATNRIAVEKRGEPPPVRPALTLYSARHARVEIWLEGGVSPMVVCELLNTSLKMLERVYSHLFESHDFLLAAVNQASRRDAEMLLCGSRTTPGRSR